MENDKRYQSLGLSEGEVRLCAYEPAWPEYYAEESRRIEEQLPAGVFKIEHIGSTSVPGLLSKPIIDITVGAESFSELESFIGVMTDLGYRYRGEYGIPDRHFFTFDEEDMTYFHVHLVLVSSELWSDLLCFRDFLRSDAEAAAMYLSEKRMLEKKFASSRESYTSEKSPIIKKILDRARASGGTQKDDVKEQL